MSQDPYGGSEGFTPYEPDATPEVEQPYVPYGQDPGSATQVPYAGGAAQFYAPVVTTTGRRVLPWIIGVIALLSTCGGGITALIAGIAASDSSSESSVPESNVVYANGLQEDQCLIGAGLDPGNDDGVSNLEVVDCSTAHDAEVIAVKVLDADEAAAYDIEDDNGAVQSCRDLFSPAEMKLLKRPDLYLIALTEKAEPVTGDKVACLLVREDGGALHGSLNDPGPQPEESEVAPS